MAFDNMRVNRESFDARLAEKRPGQLVSLTIFRFDDLSALPIKLSSLSSTQSTGSFRWKSPRTNRSAFIGPG